LRTSICQRASRPGFKDFKGSELLKLDIEFQHSDPLKFPYDTTA